MVALTITLNAMAAQDLFCGLPSRPTLPFLIQMLPLITAQDAAVELIPHLIQSAVVCWRKTQFLAVDAARVDPQMSVRMGGIGMHKANCPCLWETAGEPLPHQHANEFWGDPVFEREECAEVGPTFTASAKAGAFRLFPCPDKTD